MACGNVNSHYLPPTEPEEVGKKLEDYSMVCVLDAKHESDHSAPYPKEDKEHKGQFAFWSDAANVENKDRKFEKRPSAKKAPVVKAADKAPVKEK